MANPSLNQQTFAALRRGDSVAFLPLIDATADIQAQYADSGLIDDAGTRRIARAFLRRGVGTQAAYPAVDASGVFGARRLEHLQIGKNDISFTLDEDNATGRY